MSYVSVENIGLRGVTVAVPKQVKVAAGQPFFTPVEAENFTNVTGVVSSHVAPPGMTLSDLCEAAANRLLGEAGWERQRIQLVMFVATSGDY